MRRSQPVDVESVKERIRTAFRDTPRPGNDNLRRSGEGVEPFLTEDEFRDKLDWRTLDPAFLDQSPDGFGTALAFFSREAFRYFLPAFLLADLNGLLTRVEPVFYLWHGLDDGTRFKKVNARRYGNWTWQEAISERFEVFSREEIEAVIAYLEFRSGSSDLERPEIEQALTNYWYPRLGALGKAET